MKHNIIIVDEPMTFKQVLKEIGKKHGKHPKFSDIEISLEEGGYGACVVVEYHIDGNDDEEDEYY